MKDWMRRVEEHFANMNSNGPKASKLQSYSSLDKLSTFVTCFFEKYSLTTRHILFLYHQSSLSRSCSSCFLSLVLARSACSVTSPTNSPFMMLHAPLDNTNQISHSQCPTMFPLTSSISHYLRSTTHGAEGYCTMSYKM